MPKTHFIWRRLILKKNDLDRTVIFKGLFLRGVLKITSKYKHNAVWHHNIMATNYSVITYSGVFPLYATSRPGILTLFRQSNQLLEYRFYSFIPKTIKIFFSLYWAFFLAGKSYQKSHLLCKTLLLNFYSKKYTTSDFFLFNMQ